MMRFADRLEALSNRFDELDAAPVRYWRGLRSGAFLTALAKERASIEKTVEAFRVFRRLERELASNIGLLADERDQRDACAHRR